MSVGARGVFPWSLKTPVGGGDCVRTGGRGINLLLNGNTHPGACYITPHSPKSRLSLASEAEKKNISLGI